MSKPAHKNTERPPGQIVNKDFDRYKEIMPYKSAGDADPNYHFAKAQYEHDLDLRPRRLGDIIDRVTRQEEMVSKSFDYEAWRKRLWELIEYYHTAAHYSAQSCRDLIKHHLTLLPK